MGCNTSSEQQIFQSQAKPNGLNDENRLNVDAGDREGLLAKMDIEDQEAFLDNNSPDFKKGMDEQQCLRRYIELEQQIRRSELNNPIQMLQMKNFRLQRLLCELEAAQKELDVYEKLVASDLGLDHGAQGEHNVEQALAKIADPNSSGAPENEEYIALLNKEEMAIKTVQSLQEEKSRLELQLKEHQSEADSLNSLYRQQDQLLDEIFGQTYASAEENLLEAEIDLIEERKTAIFQVDSTWRHARTMVNVASGQLSSAIQIWKTITMNIETNRRFQIAAEVRDNLVAAANNLTSAHQSLHGVKVPYCTSEEIETLTKATAYIFTDMTTQERHEHAAQCYQSTYLRSRTLLQWIEQVIKTVISLDLETVTREFLDKSRKLRKERIHLIIKHINGIDYIGEKLLMDMYLNEDNDFFVSGPIDDFENTDDDIINDEPMAPFPSSTEIFGRINQLANDHQIEMQKYINEMNSTQGRINNHLQEVLSERRRRRANRDVDPTPTVDSGKFLNAQQGHDIDQVSNGAATLDL